MNKENAGVIAVIVGIVIVSVSMYWAYSAYTCVENANLVIKYGKDYSQATYWMAKAILNVLAIILLTRI